MWGEGKVEGVVEAWKAMNHSFRLGEWRGSSEEVTYHPLDVLRLRLAVQSGHIILSQESVPEKYKNRRETSLATALLSATFATLMCYPLDTVRSQMQMKGTPHNTVSDAIPVNVLNTLFTSLNSPSQVGRRMAVILVASHGRALLA
ncbi:unnamed protein product [Miscanthus lutarioriparius]|uniref:Uncharacterized protein n=1 Tax=Miscanthus lutarioriparius TaxID=422564 RepID=A0A811PLN2_9POAL|nr:unnamed protein product [Miscanthus lutarioriparius]